MAVFTLGAPGTLEEVLPIHGVQAWRAAYLVTCRGVTATRNGAAVDFSVDGPKTDMRRGDVVTVPDPEPAICSMPREILSRSPYAYRDYAMVTAPSSPNDTHLPRLADLFDAKWQVVRFDPPGHSLKEFAEALKHDPATAFPIRDLHIGTHAGNVGVLQIAAVPGGSRNLSFEALEAAVANQSFVIAPALLQPRPKTDRGVEIPARFVIRGCAVGQATGYLGKLKEALGGALQVVGCKFEHAAGSFSGPAGAGIYEFLAYEFEVHRPSALATDQDVVGAFIAAGFKDFRGRPIERKQWEQWVPQGRPPRSFTKVLKLRSKLAGRELNATSFFTVAEQPFFQTDVVINVPRDPGSDAARRDAVKALFTADRRFQPDHPWPGFRRLGYNSIDEMIAGHQWDFRHDASEGKLHCAGRRVTYTVHQPIVDATDGFIHNFFPTRPKGDPKEMFVDTDPRIFATV